MTRIMVTILVGLWSIGLCAQPFDIASTRLTVADPAPFDTLVWYPTTNAASARYPVLLLSHGGGPTGGSPLILRGQAEFLAAAGYVVIAPFHGANNRNLVNRPRQVIAALNAALAVPVIAARADPGRLAMIGFSLGGAVALINAGAAPDEAYLARYCATHPQDQMSCAPGSGNPRGGPIPIPPALPLKALVLEDPLAAAFPPESLARLHLPVLIVRPQQSALGAGGNVEALMASLAPAPQLVTVPGGHFVLTDVCSGGERTQSPATCQDAPGIDRTAVQRRITAEMLAFLREAL